MIANNIPFNEAFCRYALELPEDQQLLLFREILKQSLQQERKESSSRWENDRDFQDAIQRFLNTDDVDKLLVSWC